jgi:hypothetical protein
VKPEARERILRCAALGGFLEMLGVRGSVIEAKIIACLANIGATDEILQGAMRRLPALLGEEWEKVEAWMMNNVKVEGVDERIAAGYPPRL